MSQQPARAPIIASRRIWTVPNVISFIRLLGVPVFLYLLLGPHHDVAAVIVLTAGGTTDWVDGWAARRLNQVSRLGELLDPFADRLYILATLIGFTLREVVPLWLTVALLLREVVLGVGLLVLRRYGYGPPAVHYVGKTGTFVLLAAFPIVLLSQALPDSEYWLGPTGWGLMWWALALYWAAAVFYWVQTISLVRAERAGGGSDGSVPSGPATRSAPATESAPATAGLPAADAAGSAAANNDGAGARHGVAAAGSEGAAAGIDGAGIDGAGSGGAAGTGGEVVGNGEGVPAGDGDGAAGTKGARPDGPATVAG
ncbi:hypothetical protein Acsp02_52600 [Actinoplanes sp. NBRC 103695]|nr:hypothetical protein Acsp02_52600 [Actinoplanes sp. NBRC 103695]